MALFGSKKKKEIKTQAPVAKESSAGGASFDISTIIRSPRITEKASRLAEHNVYVFNVDEGASKTAIAFAVRARYNVEPLRVRVARIQKKQIVSRGKKGIVGGGKKAYVYLKEGQTIQLA